MKIFTVAEILELDAKMPISAMSGLLKRIYPAESGTAKKTGRKWTRQNIDFEDSSGEIRIQNWGQPLDVSSEGDTVLLQSVAGQKGLAGLSVGEYDNQKTIQMSEAAKITADGKPISRSAEELKQKEASTTPRDPQDLINRAAEGCRLATLAALRVAEQIKDQYLQTTGIPPTPELINSMAASINYYLREQGGLKVLDISQKPAPKNPVGQTAAQETDNPIF